VHFLKKISKDSTFLSAFLLSLFFISFPWALISRSGFPDIEMLIKTFSLIPEGITSANYFRIDSFYSYINSEILWFDLVRILASFFGSLELTFKFLSFLIFFGWSHYLIKRVSPFLAFSFLFNPLVIEVAVQGIRNGFAWLLFIYGINSKSRPLMFSLFLLSLALHKASAVLIVIYLTIKTTKKLFKNDVFFIFFISIFTALIAFSITLGREYLFLYISDRRLTPDYISGHGSFGLATIWITFLVFMSSSGLKYLKENIFIFAIIIFYLILNLFVPWAYRIWASLIPLVAISVSYLPSHLKDTFLRAYLVFFILHYIVWTKLLNFF